MASDRRIIILFVLLFIFAGQQASAKDKTSPDKSPKVYKFDLDGDGRMEIIRIENAASPDSKTQVNITRGTRADPDPINFTVPGSFGRLEVIDLNEDGYKQMAVYSSGQDEYANLAVYSFKNGKPFKVFAAASNCGIETDFRSVLARIKVGRQRSIESSNSSTDIPEWDAWVWTGEKFIRE
jgi:hypothetical protein